MSHRQSFASQAELPANVRITFTWARTDETTRNVINSKCTFIKVYFLLYKHKNKIYDD